MIYLDILFLFNLITDYLILALVKKDFFPDIKQRRLIAGTFLSAAAYVFWYCLFGGFSRGIRVVIACVLISFSILWTFRIRKTALFFKTAAASALYLFLLGGFGLFLQQKIPRLYRQTAGGRSLFLGTLILFAVFLDFGKKLIKQPAKIKECTYEVEIKRKTHSISLRGLYDSGNLLSSKMTGKGICVLSFREAEKLMDEEEKERLSFLVKQKDFPWKTMAENLWSGIYCITYSSVGKEEGWMPGIIADHIIVKKDEEVLTDIKGLMGVTAQRISKDERFAVLLPADIFTDRK